MDLLWKELMKKSNKMEVIMDKNINKPLAFNIYPLPNGIRYSKSDLLNGDILIDIFNYCQILEATIFPAGWELILGGYTLDELLKLNTISGWLDVDNIEDLLSEIKELIVE